MSSHEFGGAWTEVKLDAVEYYLKCYTKALSRAGFDLWYLDAFAGTGDRDAKKQVGGLFDGMPVETVTETLDGSAKRALQISPAFHHYVFMEKHPDRFKALSKLKENNPLRRIDVINQDANSALLEFTSKPPWTGEEFTKSRGVVFLDPYAMQVDFETLAALAKTQLLDVWYLFPLRDVVRQLARNLSGVGPKEKKLDKCLSEAWRDLYQLPPPSGQTSFGYDLFTPPEHRRDASSEQIEEWFKTVLQREFAMVSDPLPILTEKGRQTFSLFLCVGNPSKPAIDLATKFVNHVNKKYGGQR